MQALTTAALKRPAYDAYLNDSRVLKTVVIRNLLKWPMRKAFGQPVMALKATLAAVQTTHAKFGLSPPVAQDSRLADEVDAADAAFKTALKFLKVNFCFFT